MRVLFIVPYPKGAAPSQRFRFEHYLNDLETAGITYRIQSFWDSATWNILYKPGRQGKKIVGLVKGFFRRFGMLFLVGPYNYIYIHREATPLGPAWFEWTVTRVFGKKLIYDFDDAIWIPVVSKNNRLAKAFRNFSKVGRNCRRSTVVVTGNSFLANYALQFNRQVVVIPTVVDTVGSHNKLQDQNTNQPSIGWTGTFSTLKYIDEVIPALRDLQERHRFKFVVIADKDPRLDLPGYEFVPWSKDQEANDLLRFHIGLMPLDDSDLSKGKCGFKAIQYMSVGIPAVVSPVGVNTEIVDDGVNGFLCKTEWDWKTRLEELLANSSLRSRLGLAAKEKIERKYSVNATRAAFLDLFTIKNKKIVP